MNEILFYSIQYICSLSDLDAPSKIISFESMAMWLTECKVTMRNKDIVGYVTAVLNQENTECLVRYVWDHWDDPIEAVQQKASLFLFHVFLCVNVWEEKLLTMPLFVGQEHFRELVGCAATARRLLERTKIIQRLFKQTFERSYYDGLAPKG